VANAANAVSDQIAAHRTVVNDRSEVNDHAANGRSAPIVSRGRPLRRAKQQRA
jgi:hypothetical protein